MSLAPPGEPLVPEVSHPQRRIRCKSAETAPPSMAPALTRSAAQGPPTAQPAPRPKTSVTRSSSACTGASAPAARNANRSPRRLGSPRSTAPTQPPTSPTRVAESTSTCRCHRRSATPTATPRHSTHATRYEPPNTRPSALCPRICGSNSTTLPMSTSCSSSSLVYVSSPQPDPWLTTLCCRFSPSSAPPTPPSTPSRSLSSWSSRPSRTP